MNRAARRMARKPKGRAAPGATMTRVLVRATTREQLIKPGALNARVDHGIRQRPVVQLPDGALGYCMHPRRHDDCLTAAVATAIQVPIEQLPDLHLDKRLAAGEDRDAISRDSWDRIDRWAHKRGYELELHETAPVDRERWIGVWPTILGADEIRNASTYGWDWEQSPPFTDHCVVMAHGDVYFDPSCSLSVRRGDAEAGYPLHVMSYALTLTRKDDHGPTS